MIMMGLMMGLVIEQIVLVIIYAFATVMIFNHFILPFPYKRGRKKKWKKKRIYNPIMEADLVIFL